MIAFDNVAVRSDTAQSHADFLPIKEVIERYAGVAFRNRPETGREEAVAEAVAAAFVNFLSLKRRGKNPAQFPSVIAVRAIQRVRAELVEAGRVPRIWQQHARTALDGGTIAITGPN